MVECENIIVIYNGLNLKEKFSDSVLCIKDFMF